MKKPRLYITTIAFLIIATHVLKAQNNNKEDEKCVKQGKFIIDAYYGYPYIFGEYIFQFSFTDINGNANEFAVHNHLGGKFEYMVNKSIGLEIDYNCASATAKGSYTSKIVTHRMLAKINIHFSTSKYLDPYATGGIGYENSLASSEHPNEQEKVAEINNEIQNILPISYRLGLGLRYYFIKNLGICVEAGIGGPILQAGLSGKF